VNPSVSRDALAGDRDAAGLVERYFWIGIFWYASIACLGSSRRRGSAAKKIEADAAAGGAR
jgi:hypothetical protein